MNQTKIILYILVLAMGVNILAQYNGYAIMVADRGMFVKVLVAVTLIYVDWFILSGVYQLLKYLSIVKHK